MFCSSKLKTTPRGGERPPSRDGKAPPTVAAARGGVDQPVSDQLMQISVRGAPHQTHTLELKLSDTMSDVNAEVELLGYDLGVDRLCRFGGASLPQDDRVTLVESGLHPNSSLQVLGRLRGGVEVPLFGRQHSLGDTGLLDLMGQDVGPAKLKEVAAFLASPESAAVRRLVLSSNMITDRGKDLSGLKELCEVLPTLKHPISLNLSDCGLGIAEVNEVAAAIHVGAAVARLSLSGNLITGSGPANYLDRRLDKDLTGVTGLFDTLKTSSVTELGLADCGLGPGSMAKLAEYVREATAVVARLSLHGNMITGSKAEFERGQIVWKYDNDLSGLISLCDSLKTSQVTEVDFSSCGIGPIALNHLSEWVRETTAALTSINCLNNPLGEEAQVIIKIFEETPRLRTLCGLEEGVQQIDWSESGKGPADVALLAAELKAGRAAAAVASLRCANNPSMVGKLDWRGELETPDAHAEVFKELTDSLKTSQVTEADFSSCGIGPVALGHLSEWVREATAAVKKVALSKNFLFGSKLKYGTYGHTVHDVDADQTGWSLLCESFKGSSIEELILRDVGMGVNGVATLADAIKFMTALNSLKCANNPGMVGELEHGRLKTPDAHAEVFKQLTDNLKTSQVTEADFSSCGLGPVALGHLSEWVRDAEAALNEVNVAFNKIGSEGGIALRDALKTSNLKFITIGKMYTSAGGTVITGSQVTTGVTLSAGGRLGELIKGPDSDFDVKLKWADTGKESSYMKLHSLDGEPLKLPLQSPFEGEHLDLAHQQLDPGYVLLLSWWLGTEFSAASAQRTDSTKVAKVAGLNMQSAKVTALILLADIASPSNLMWS